MKIIKRDICAITNKDDMEHLHTLKDFPVFMGCTMQEEDLLVDMDWRISRSSGFIQLSQLIPLEILYAESHGAGTVGKAWERHHEAFAKFISKYQPKDILEIGGGHGILSKEYHRMFESNWTIVEPNPTPAEGVKAKYKEGFFDAQFEFEEDYDMVIHSHLLEHMYEPNSFLEHIASFIEEGKLLLFSVPNMEVMLEKKYTNCINFEHTFFLTEPYIEYLLAMHGFRIENKEYFMNDHSIFYAAYKDKNTESIVLDSNLYETNKRLYLNFVDYHVQEIKNINQKIQNTKQPVFLFGAHIFAQYLLAFGLYTDTIIAILDNDKNKQEKRLYGTRFNVFSPKVLKEYKNPIVILRAGIYNDEIKEDILQNINNNVIFI